MRNRILQFVLRINRRVDLLAKNRFIGWYFRIPIYIAQETIRALAEIKKIWQDFLRDVRGPARS